MSYKSSPSFESIPLARPQYRADIDGLRALAVLSVVGFHAFPNWVKGGFIGVDIFFVISGFLISSIIFGGLDQASFSFTDFYARRIRRIFPALILVMTVCYVFGWFALFPDEYSQLGKHIFGGAFFFSNFFFWSEAGYFDSSAETKPLLHLWSLGIEEQFYIVWPLLLFVAWKRKFNVLILVIVITLISFTLNIAGVQQDSTGTFYSPVSRFWELLMGSVLAYGRQRKIKVLHPISQRMDALLSSTVIYSELQANDGFLLRNTQAMAGIALIVLAVLLLSKVQLFPGWWALLPTLGAYLIILADSAWLNRVVLSNRVLVWFGMISYPLYLWHWPLLSFAQIVESGTTSPEIQMLAVAIAVLLAWLTYLLIEKPIRFGKHIRAKVIVLCLLMVLLGAVGYSTYKQDGLGFRSTITASLQQQQAFVWKSDKNTQEACIKRYPFYGSFCLQAIVDESPTVALIGDSHANHLFFGLSEYYKGQGDNLLLLGARLPFWNLETGPAGTQDTFVFYKEVMNNILNYVTKTDSIKTIILSSTGVAYVVESSYHLKLTTQPNLLNHEKIFEQAMRETLQQLVKTGKQIIFVIDNPELAFDPKSCVDNRPLRLTTRTKSLCAIERSVFNKHAAMYHAAVKTVLQDFPTVKAFSIYQYLCDENYCWAMRDGKMLYRDNTHLSHDGSLYIGRKFGLEQDLNR